MKPSISISSLMGKKFQTYGFSPDLIAMLGEAEVGFTMLVWGPSGNGKSTFAGIVCKALACHGKVYYNSVEQGHGKSLQDLCRHVGLDQVGKNFVIGDRDTYPDMLLKLKRNQASFVVIDSLQYIMLTTLQFKELKNRYPKKAFIIISWEEGGKQPKGEHAKGIRYMCDIKVYVKSGIADIMSRFGATAPYHIPGVYQKFNQPKPTAQGVLF